MASKDKYYVAVTCFTLSVCTHSILKPTVAVQLSQTGLRSGLPRTAAASGGRTKSSVSTGIRELLSSCSRATEPGC